MEQELYEQLDAQLVTICDHLIDNADKIDQIKKNTLHLETGVDVIKEHMLYLENNAIETLASVRKTVAKYLKDAPVNKRVDNTYEPHTVVNMLADILSIVDE